MSLCQSVCVCVCLSTSFLVWIVDCVCPCFCLCLRHVCIECTIPKILSSLDTRLQHDAKPFFGAVGVLHASAHADHGIVGYLCRRCSHDDSNDDHDVQLRCSLLVLGVQLPGCSLDFPMWFTRSVPLFSHSFPKCSQAQTFMLGNEYSWTFLAFRSRLCTMETYSYQE